MIFTMFLKQYLQPIMFADNTNLFSSQGNIKDPFHNVNRESRFKDKKQSSNEGKTK